MSLIGLHRLGQQAGDVWIEYGEEPARPDLYRQGVRPDQFYAINEAASRVYCRQKIATPPTK